MAGENSSRAHGTAAPEQQATGVLKIVWLRQMLQGWQSTAAGTAARRSDASVSGDQQDDTAGHRVQDEDTATRHVDDDDDKKALLVPTPAESADRRPRTVEELDRCGGFREDDLWGDEREDPGSEPMTPDAGAPVDVPRGCCAVYVGAERRRFVVPTAYLGMQVFRRLLEKAEEEFGFDYVGGALTIPCETEVFKYILVVMDRHQKGLVDDEGNPNEEEGESSETRD